MTRRCSACLVLLAAALGCGSDGGAANADDPDTNNPPIGGQTGEETIGCLAVETRALAWSERSPLGFSADELLTALGDERESQLERAGGTRTRLRLRLELERGGGAPQFEEREWVQPNLGAAEPAAEISAACDDVISLPATLRFDTNDGAFAEALSLQLLAESRTRATATLSLDPAMLQGTFSATEVEPGSYDELRLIFTLVFESDTWFGNIEAQAIDNGDGSPDGAVSERNVAIGTF
jgi:hypothetical protein